MTSFVYTEMEKLNPRTVLHERETSSSGRPKPTHGPTEDTENYYTYTRTGKVTVYPKTDLDKYWDWLENEVIFQKPHPKFSTTQGTLNVIGLQGSIRLTPATDYEISMGYGAFNPADQTNPASPIFVPNWNAVNAYGQGGYASQRNMSKMTLKKVSDEHFRKLQEAQDEADRLAYLAEQERLKKLRETARPNPKEVEKVEPVEVEPIEEVVKYSPLMIAGVIAVIVIILWRRA